MKLNISHLLTIAGIIFLLQTVVVANEWIPLNDQSPGEVVFELAGETPDSLELSTMVTDSGNKKPGWIRWKCSNFSFTKAR